MTHKKGREYYEAPGNQLNVIHTELQQMPDKYKYAHPICPTGVLNAYREGDITFDSACKLLKLEITITERAYD